MVQIGIIEGVDYERDMVTVRIGELLTGWSRWLTARAGKDATWWAPEIGEQVVVFSPNGDFDFSVVLPGIYQSLFPGPENRETIACMNFEDGTRFEYDRLNHDLNISVIGDIKIECTGSMEFVAKRIDFNPEDGDKNE